LTQASGAVTKKIALAIWGLGILGPALAGFCPDSYLIVVRGLPQPLPYPAETVGWIALLVSIQVLVLFSILRFQPFRPSWRRALLAVAVSLGFLSLGVIGAMHAPPPWSAYLLWLLLILIGMLVILGQSAVEVLRSRSNT